MNLYVLICFIIFTIIEVFVAIQFSRKQNKILLNKSIVSYLGLCLIIFLQYKFKLEIPQYILVLIIITMLGNSFLGNYLNLYNRSKTYDRYLHAFGAFTTALYVYILINRLFNPIINPRLYETIFIISLGISIGALFEIIEFAQDSFKKTNNQKGLKDTDLDLIFNAIGSIIAGIYAYFYLAL